MPTVGRHVSALVVSFAVAGTASGPRTAHAQTAPVFDAGQERNAIYPVYDGYTRNADGSLTLSFAYFSHNADAVTIPLGPNNAFAPGTADRGQPTSFLPGHHRWQCVMVVDPDFDGQLRWTLTHAGATWATSASMLQYNWELSDRDLPQALRGIEDPTTTPRHVCLNRPPVVRVLGYGGSRGPYELQVRVSQPLKLFGSVRDEGLPRGGGVTAMWTVARGPGRVRFDEPDAPRTLAYFAEPGEYVIELTGSDSELTSVIEVAVLVSP